MRIKRWATTAGLVGTITAASLTLGAAPASASPTAVNNDRQTCVSGGGGWTQHSSGGTGYTCTYQYATYWNVYYFLSSGEYYGFASGAGQLQNGGSGSNYHTP